MSLDTKERKKYKMEYVLMVPILILTYVFFKIVNKMFNIVYFGFKGIGSVILGCFFAASMITLGVEGFIYDNFSYKWVIAAVVVVAIAVFIKARNKSGIDEITTESAEE